GRDHVQAQPAGLPPRTRPRRARHTASELRGRGRTIGWGMSDIGESLEVREARKTRVYHAIVDQIRELLAEGRVKPGDRLPPERELAERFKASRNSVRDAIRVLEQRGLIESRQG